MDPTIEESVNAIIKAKWDITTGTVVPKTEDIVLKNGGRLLEATYLYADLAGSSKLAQEFTKEAAAKVIRAYVNTATRILRKYGGEIRSFDGDRVMAIFVGSSKNWNAVRAAFAINWAVGQVITPAFRKYWEKFDQGKDFEMKHGIGIDTGEALIVRGGARDNNDLISVGASPNVAAKFSDLRLGHSIYITDAVRDSLTDDMLHADIDGKRTEFWSKLYRQTDVGGRYYPVNASNIFWGF